jgi:hypothetical protein
VTHRPSVRPAHRFRLLTAIALVPFVDAAVAYLGFPFVWAMGGHSGRLIDPDDVAFGFAVISGVLGFLVTCAGAVPFALWLAKRGSISLRKALVAGLLLGNAPFGVFVIALVLPATIGHLMMGTMSQHLAPLSSLVAGTLRVVVIGSGMGAVSAAVFWLVGIRERNETTPSVIR